MREIILSKNYRHNLEGHEINNNVLICGTPGCGKTYNYVIPNILQMTGSYIISDPKGNLYYKLKNVLTKNGYQVKLLDFTNPEDSCRYNPLKYVTTDNDVIKLAKYIIYAFGETTSIDPFWDEAATLLLSSVIGYVKSHITPQLQNMFTVCRLILQANSYSEEKSCSESQLDEKFKIISNTEPQAYYVKLYQMFKQAADRTSASIRITLNAKLYLFLTQGVQRMTREDEINIADIGDTKTAVFVVTSDTDRSMDPLANIFYTQAFNTLCLHADKECLNNKLPLITSFILDDFATNIKIPDFQKLIASVRSRGISIQAVIQSESQLKSIYENDCKTIIGCCDTYIYMGCNDVETNEQIAKRFDRPLSEIMYMPLNKVYITQRGKRPITDEKYDAREHELYKMINDTIRTHEDSLTQEMCLA